MISELLLTHSLNSGILTIVYLIHIILIWCNKVEHGKHTIKLRWSLPRRHPPNLTHDHTDILWYLIATTLFKNISLRSTTDIYIDSLYISLYSAHIRLTCLLLLLS